MTVSKSRPASHIFLAIVIVLVLLGIGLGFYNSVKSQPATPGTLISQSALEEQYGLRVNLIAVTAAGGMVDLRLKITDGEKAKKLLQEKTNFPALYVSDANLTLNASEEAKSQEIQFEDNSNLYLLFPNAGNAAQRGDTINVLFGDMTLESIEAQ